MSPFASLALLESIKERWKALRQRLSGPLPGYVFRLDLDESTLRHFRGLYLAYLRRFPHRFAGGALEDVPEFRPFLDAPQRGACCNFTCYVVARLAQERERFDFQRYIVDYHLLEQLLELRPWANEDDLCRVAEALYFLSPAGYRGVIYWPLGSFLRQAKASHGGRPPCPRLAQTLERMADELRITFAFGYAAEVGQCLQLLDELLWPQPRFPFPQHRFPRTGADAGARYRDKERRERKAEASQLSGTLVFLPDTYDLLEDYTED